MIFSHRETKTVHAIWDNESLESLEFIQKYFAKHWLWIQHMDIDLLWNNACVISREPIEYIEALKIYFDTCYTGCTPDEYAHFNSGNRLYIPSLP